MSLHEGTGYGGGQPKRRPWPWVLAGCSLILLVAWLVFLAVAGGSEQEPAAPLAGPAPVATETPAAAEAPAGTDAGVDPYQAGPAVEPEAWSTLMAFLDGWRATDQTVREQILADTAAPDLAEGLADTSPYKRLVAPVDRVEIMGVWDHSAEFRIWFRDVKTATAIVVVRDPDARYGWLVTDIRRPA